MMKGYALLVGVTEVSLNHYTDRMMLPCAQTDVDDLETIVQSTGMYDRIDKLVAGEANSTVFFRLLDQYIKKSKTEDGYLVIYFSGHGASIPYKPSKNKEFLCFYDRMVLENEIRKQLCEFGPRFKVFFIIDSCFSSGIAEQSLFMADRAILKTIFPTGTEIGNPTLLTPFENKVLHLQESSFTEQAQLFLPKRGYQKRAPKGVIFDTFGKNSAHYASKMTLFWKDYIKYKTDICYINACESNQLTETGALLTDTSYFTQRLKVLWKKFQGNGIGYEGFHQLLKKHMRTDIQPTIKILPNENPDNFFRKTQPFYFNKNKTVTQKLAVMEDITLEENMNATPLVATGLATGLQIYKPIKSVTYDLKAQAGTPIVDYLVKLLGDDLEDGIEFLGVIHVEIAEYSGFPHTVTKMFSHSGTPKANGLIILLEDESYIKGKKRTTGRVSNKMGEQF